MTSLNTRSNAVKAIFWGGMIAAVLDLAAAFAIAGTRSRTPDVVLHGIASGVLGTPAYLGGFWTGALGVALHLLICFILAAFYYVLSRRLRLLVRMPVVSGLIYGAGTFLFMNYIVIPISAIRNRPAYTTSGLIVSLAAVMCCVGLPIALTVRKYSDTLLARVASALRGR